MNDSGPMIVAFCGVVIASLTFGRYYLRHQIASKKDEMNRQKSRLEKRITELELQLRDLLSSSGVKEPGAEARRDGACCQKLKAIQAELAKTPLSKYEYVDTFLLGPRGAGKSHVTLLWTEPHKNIGSLVATTVLSGWNRFIVRFATLKSTQVRHPVFEIEQKLNTYLALRVHDYPGEREYLLEAIEDLKQHKLEKQRVVLFFFKNRFDGRAVTDDLGEEKSWNRVFYNDYFLKKLKEHFDELTDRVSRFIVVFNKFQNPLKGQVHFPAHWSKEEMLKQLIAANQEAIAEMRKRFDPSIFEFAIIDADSGEGVHELLGKMAGRAVPTTVEPSFTDTVTNPAQQ